MTVIPHCDDLYLTYFDCWMSDEWRRIRVFEATRPDVQTMGSYAGGEPSELSFLDKDGRDEVSERIAAMFKAARGDFSSYLGVREPVDLTWIQAFDAYYDRAKIAKLIEESNPSDFENSYLVTCCEFGAVLGHVLLDRIPNLQWIYGWPYWESLLLYPDSGSLIPPFHWAVKKMSEYGVEDGFAEKIEMCALMLADGNAG